LVVLEATVIQLVVRIVKDMFISHHYALLRGDVLPEGRSMVAILVWVLLTQTVRIVVCALIVLLALGLLRVVSLLGRGLL
jgi:hypothetical protein